MPQGTPTNNSLSGGSVVLLGALLGLMMAFDMGGPLNKTAYLFATTRGSIVAQCGLFFRRQIFIGLRLFPWRLATGLCSFVAHGFSPRPDEPLFATSIFSIAAATGRRRGHEHWRDLPSRFKA